MNWLPVFSGIVGYVDIYYRDGKFYDESFYKDLIKGLKKCNDELRTPFSGNKGLDHLFDIADGILCNAGVLIEDHAARDLHYRIHHMLKQYDYSR